MVALVACDIESAPHFELLRAMSKGQSVYDQIEFFGKRLGLEVEKSKVTTKDGFILDLYRVWDKNKRNH